MTTYAALPTAEIGLPDPAQWMDLRSIRELFEPACRCRACVTAGRAPDPADVRACDSFFGLVWGQFHDFAYHHLPLGIADDFSQDLCYELLGEMPSFEPKTAIARLSAWLYHRPRSRAADLLRRRSRGRRRRFEPDDELIPGDEEDPLAAVLRIEDRERVGRALAELRGQLRDPAEYNILYLREMEGLSVKQTAARLRLASDVVRDRHRRGRANLRTILSRRA